jgi:hypothetical protein
MAKKCKTREDIIIRTKAYHRLLRIKNCFAAVVPLEIYGLKTDKTGAFTLEDLVKLLD